MLFSVEINFKVLKTSEFRALVCVKEISDRIISRIGRHGISSQRKANVKLLSSKSNAAPQWSVDFQSALGRKLG